MSTKYYLPMAVMAMTALNHAVTFEQDGFTSKGTADVCFIQSEEADGTDTRTTQQFVVRGSLTLGFETDNAKLSIQQNFAEVSSDYAALNARADTDLDSDGDKTDNGETNTVSLVARDNTKTLLSVTVYEDETFSISADAGDLKEGFSWVTNHEDSALGYALTIDGGDWAISATSSTSLASGKWEGTSVAGTGEINRGDFNFAVSAKTDGLLYDGLKLALTYKDSTNYFEVSGGMDISDYTGVEGSYANLYAVTNTDESDENWAYGADVRTAFALSEYEVNLAASYTVQQEKTQSIMSAPNRHHARVTENDVAAIGTAQTGEDLTTLVVSAGAVLGGHNVMAFYGHSQLKDEEHTLMGVCLNLIG
ncbi:hypothetical protein N9N03_01945 [Chlamydiia bacterium]|nr:hypothetical protein [Chlamydiia bacterium]